jgi:peptidoglycan/LPS O-acetylase OafA/YrhL
MRFWLRLALVPLVAGLVLAGIWVAGGLVTDDFRLAMVLTALWLAVAGGIALVVARRRRALALPVLGTVLVTAAVAGGYLLYASSVDRVVREQVAAAAPGGNVAVAAEPSRAPGMRRPARQPSSGSRRAARCSR